MSSPAHRVINRNLPAWLLAGLVLLLPALSHAGQEAGSLSFPAISADGRTVYFSSWGDIWSAPVSGDAAARRLTDNVAYDARPTISPDGRRIAFLSDRFGNFDIFVMPEQGGAAERLTWDSAVDYPYDWNSDGTAVLAYTMRQDLWGLCAYEIQLDGSQPVRLTGPDHDDHVFASYLGSDNKLVYTRGPDDWARQHYRGQENYDLWTADRRTGEHSRLTSYDGKDCWPQPTPDGDRIYFVSSRSGYENIWELTPASGDLRQITRFDKGTVRWPRISADGDELVYERGGQLWRTDLISGESDQIRVFFADDYKHEMALTMSLTNQASEYAVSPNGNYYALVVYGDIYVLKNPDSYKDEPDQNTARAFRVVDSPGREMQVSWSPDSLELTYISDREGQFDVYAYDLAQGKERRITVSPEEEWYPTFSPKGKRFAYYRGHRLLVVNEPGGDGETVLFEGQLRNGPWSLGYEWAPDGYWLSFTASNLDYRADVYIINIEDREPVNVSFTPDWNQGGAWSSDGKYLAYTHGGESDAEVMLLELSPEPATYDTDLLFPDDMPEDEESETDYDIAEDADNGPEDETEEGSAEPGSDDKAEDDLEPLEIDLDRIHLRARSVTSMRGEAYDQFFAPGSDYLVFVSDHDGDLSWWSVTLDGSEYNLLTGAFGNESPQWSPDGSKMYFLSGGAISYMTMAGSAPSGGGMVRAACEADLDQFAIWEQMLSEGWRHLRDGFYDRDMHGRDWPAILQQYRPRVRDISTSYEYGRLYREMLGELGASHLGFYGYPGDAEAPPEVTGSFGIVFAEDYPGPGWMVERVITDGPADQPGSRLYPGDVISAVNGIELEASDNRSRLLRNAISDPITLTVANGDAALAVLFEEADDPAAANDDGLAEREVVIMPAPAGSLRQLYYEQWVLDNRRLVYEMSDSRVGYQHIQGMNQPSLAKFRRELFSESRDKDAVIIDVRFNGGGNISENLVDLLDRQPFAREAVRGGAKTTQPALYWGKPVVVLINAHSFSDAEYFPHVIKELGLGTIIGEPTGGNVIGTYDFPLLDGSMLRIPAWGIWLLDGTNMEGNGTQPDIYIEIDPESIALGVDNQLMAAVEYLLAAE